MADEKNEKKKDEDDPRIDFLCSFVIKSMRLKVDKWAKLMGADNLKVTVMEWLNQANLKTLIITMNTSGALIPMLAFPTGSKTKSCYFIKKNPVELTASNIRNVCIFGDLSPRPVDDLAILVDKLFFPILNNPNNQIGWPKVIIMDVGSHLQELRNIVAEVQGNILNQTLLPMPMSIDNIMNSLDSILEDGPYDLELKNSIEGIVIKWSSEIEEVLMEESISAFNNDNNPTPIVEINFWKARCKNLENIYNQLCNERIKAIAMILEYKESVYYTAFRLTFQKVVLALHEAKDISLHLLPLIKYIDIFESTDFGDTKPSITPFIYCMCLIWENSNYYNTNEHFVTMFKMICNLIIAESSKHLDPGSLFQGEPDESLIKLNNVIDIIEHFKNKLFYYKEESGKLVNFNKPENKWTFSSRDVLNRLDIYLERLYQLKKIFESACYFHKLEKVEIGGVNGRNISRKITEIYDHFITLYGNWVNITFDPLNPDTNSNDFKRVETKFMNSVEILERTLAEQLLLAFDECCNVDQYTKIMQVIGSLLQQPIVLKETEYKFKNILKLFNDDLNLVKLCFEQGVDAYRLNGFKGIPIDRGFPPIAGTIMWIQKFQQRLTNPFNNFNFIEYPIFDCEEGEYIKSRYDEMLALLSEYEKGIYCDWQSSVSDIIKKNMNDYLLKRNKNDEEDNLEINFNPQLVAVLLEMKHLNAFNYSDLPSSAIEFYNKEENLWEARVKLNKIVDWYNDIRLKSNTYEFNLIADEITNLNEKLNDLSTCEKWNHYNQKFIDLIFNKLNNLHKRLLQSQENIRLMLKSIKDWGSEPLYVRKDNTDVNLLNIDERLSIVKKRFKKCQYTNKLISSLIGENFILLSNYEELANAPYIDSDEESNENKDEENTEHLRSESGTNTGVSHDVSLTFGGDEETTRLSLEDENLSEEIEGEEEDSPILKVMRTIEQAALFRPYEEYIDQLLAVEIMDAVNVSLSYISNEIQNRFEHNAPLFEVRLELQEPKLVFLPSFNKGAQCTFMLIFQDLIVDIYNMADIINRVAQPPESERMEEDGTLYCATYETYLAQNTVIEEIKREMITEVKRTLREAKIYMSQYKQKYGHIWLDDKKVFLEKFLIYGRRLIPEELELIGQGNFNVKENPPTMEIFKQMIDYYYNLYDEVLEIETSHVFRNWLLVNMKLFKSALLNGICKWTDMLKQHLIDEVINSLKKLDDFIAAGVPILREEVTMEDFNALLNVMSVLTEIRNREADTDFMFEPLRAIVDMLKAYNVEFPKLIYDQLDVLPEKWIGLKKLAFQVKHDIAPIQAYYVDLITKRITLYEFRQKLYRSKFKKLPCFQHPCPDIYNILDKVHNDITVMEENSFDLDDLVELFDLNAIDKTRLFSCKREIVMLKQLWDFVLVVDSSVDDWKRTLWSKIDIEDMEVECKRLTKDIRLLDKEMRFWDLYIYLESVLKNLLTSLKAINELQNPAIRERHWIELMNTTKVVVKMDDSATLADLLDLNLHKFEDQVKEIVDKSVKEMVMESILKDLEATWNTMEFEFEQHQRTNIEVMKASDELIEILEDNQVQLQNLMNSKFIAYFLEEVTDWQIKLSNADQIIAIWLEVQRKWMYLESIFIGSEDIRKQLPQDSELFDNANEKFNALLRQLSANRNVVQATNQEGLFEQLEEVLDMLIICEKALNDYLETKRLAFPRFYFVSSVDLLDILSNGNQPELVCKHLAKLYDSIMTLKFGLASKSAVGMFAKENDEYVEFKQKCDCSGNVEIWLNRVTDSMRYTLHSLFAAALTAYDNKARDQWVFDWPAQPALCITQICWTTEVNIVFDRLEEGYENALKDYQKKQIALLNVLIVLLLADLSQGDRQKIMTICTIDVHSRDVVAKMIQQKVESASAFQWQSQLRHRWDLTLNDCFANICDAQFKYDYEYLGNTPRLVITPLTDRCYITLTQSLHLIMGGAPAGPAGTGKTETTKDLGRALGIMVYVFNCSEQMDYKSCGNIYKGLAQTGAWGCFDEFNRISVEVLSVVAVQVKTIQDAIKSKKPVFNFMGSSIVLIPTIGIFITMNPGYAGRTELPENLKARFRPCAMVVPDFALISEIMLVAEGFQDARLLARKFITLYTLCKELLSKQDHYDWGLRAIKSVLVVAGSLKRGDRLRPEDQVLMRALRDFNIPKIVTDDVPVFMGLIGDLFPALDIPRKRSMDFEKLIRQSTIDLHLQPDDGFVLKVVQLEELFAVRHSVFIVGNAGTGKTQVWKTLNRTYFNQKRKPFYNDLNPKAVTNNELFGIINPVTREWKDGLLSILMREQANMSGNGPKWIVLDGDIDPMWIESLNTVMDDNKVLTLASNERIALTKEMRLLFEIGHLKSATPATVSRAGILYINAQDLGWYPFVASWLQTRESPQERNFLSLLFDKYIPPLLEVNKRLKRITPISDIAMIQMSCHLLDCLLIPQNTPRDCPKEWYEIYFAFALIWGFGSALFQDQLIDWRAEFNKWWLNEFKTVKFPPNKSIFNFFIDSETKKFLPWNELTPLIIVDFDIPLQSMLIPTAETTRLRYFLDILIEKNHPVMLIGGAGSGKSVIVTDKLNSLSEKYAITNVPFNFYTTSEMLQKVLEKPLEKKAGRNFGPPAGKSMIYFADDMNMPEVDSYGTVQPHTIIRQFMDYQHWYDRTKMSLKDIHNCMFASCMNPTAGSFTIDTRLQRHFCTFAVSYPDADALYHIYSTILSQHLQLPGNKFPLVVQNVSNQLIKAALLLHVRIQQNFLPTAVKFHYVFNLRDLSNIFTGMLYVNGSMVKDKNELIRLWMHESTRVYCDKLVNDRDIDEFKKLVADVVKKEFQNLNDTYIFSVPLIYCHFAEGLTEQKYMPIASWNSLHKLLTEAQLGYNDVVVAMNLVLFEDAMAHICRISRILEAPRGNALLIGVGGSGKQSLANLAAFISSLSVFQLQLRKGYSMLDMKSDLAVLYTKAGIKNIPSMFLMTDAQVGEESFLVLINDMLASGDIPDLFPDDEVEEIISTLRNEVKQVGLIDTRDNCWKYYIEKVRGMLKTVLCFSPVGSTLRIRARKFPAIVNCTAIDWFHEWPKTALESVSSQFLSELESLQSEFVEPVSIFMAYVHETVNAMSVVYLQNEKRYNYTTPKTFLELISLYSKLLSEKTNYLKDMIKRLENGLIKLAQCSEQVDGLQEILKEQEITLKVKNEAADKLIVVVSAENEKVEKEKNLANEEEKKVRLIEEDVSAKAKLCEEDLRRAEPALIAAQEALNTLNKNNLTELKSFSAPPQACVMVCAAVIVLFSTKEKIPKNRNWKAAKEMMGKVDNFLYRLINYDKEHISPLVIEALQPYINDPNFDPEKIFVKSAAAAGLCAWVININKFYHVYLVVEPKQRALKETQAALNHAREQLAFLNEKIFTLENKLAIIQEEFNGALIEKEKCQSQADKTAFTIDLAHRLVNGLASEKIRWRLSLTSLREQITTLPGDVLLISCFLSYVGCFTRRYRAELQNKMWMPKFKMITPEIPHSEQVDVLDLISDDAQIAEWNNEGLPNDRMSSENATILTNSARWPLMIDPQLQGIKWIKQRFGSNLVIIRLTTKGYLDKIEKALSDGVVVLLENIGETVDAVLDPLLGRALIKKGTAIKIGDREMDYNPRFKFILHTKLANPHFKPEMQAQTTLINFTVTRDGLEEQLLAEVVKAERPDLETLKTELTMQQNSFKIKLKALEDDLLRRLSSAGENVLEDPTLVLNLEKTKFTAAEVKVKVEEAKTTAEQIDETRDHYRQVAERASILYFILNELYKINPIYQFSLKAFTVVFKNAIKVATPAEKLRDRVFNLIESITYKVFQYTTRGLFEKDKLIFVAQMVIQIMLQQKDIEPMELDFLLRYPFTPNLTSPFDFIPNNSWGGIKALSLLDAFHNLDKDIEGSSKRWKKFMELETPEREKFPGEWKNKNTLQRLCIMRALRPDRMTYAVSVFVEENLGKQFTQARQMEFSKSYEEMSSTTPVFFILSPGVDPLKDVEKLGRHLKYTTDHGNFYNVSLGQGQEIVAEAAIDVASSAGYWVILQNVHLVAKWLPTLEKKMETIAESCHNNYRLFLSAEPAASAEYHIIPQGILESAIKITNEPPTGMSANIHKALNNFNQETLEMCSKESEFKVILFSLCYFHAVVAERRKFGAQGWNRIYPFNAGDLTISVYVLYNYLEANNKVPWEDLRYLFGEIMYGGHITDDWDRRLCRTYLEEYMQAELMDGELYFAKGFPSPPNSDFIGYHSYIHNYLPAESPILYGLHPNAEIGFQTNTSENLFRTIFELQPRDSEASSGMGVSREDSVKYIADDIFDKLPEEFNMQEIVGRVEERTPFIIVAFQECERMNTLLSELKRSLKEVMLGLKGELTVTPTMEKLEDALYFDNIPESWTRLAYPSLLGLQAWFADLMLRLKELEQWSADFTLPNTVWLAGFFNPQSFLTAIMQQTARKNEWPLDRMCLSCDVTKKQKAEFTSPPREGAYVNGLFMDGARWNTMLNSIGPSRLKELYPMMPVIFIKAITQDKQEIKNIYECPVYKTKMRGPTFVWTFNLKTKVKPSVWILGGVCLLLQI